MLSTQDGTVYILNEITKHKYIPNESLKERKKNETKRKQKLFSTTMEIY